MKKYFLCIKLSWAFYKMNVDFDNINGNDKAFNLKLKQPEFNFRAFSSLSVFANKKRIRRLHSFTLFL